jgi:hypothetical protein
MDSVSLVDTPRVKLALERIKNASSSIVWGASSKERPTPFQIVESEAKVEQNGFHDGVLYVFCFYTARIHRMNSILAS